LNASIESPGVLLPAQRKQRKWEKNKIQIRVKMRKNKENFGIELWALDEDGARDLQK